jgi:hypothetical protein
VVDAHRLLRRWSNTISISRGSSERKSANWLCPPRRTASVSVPPLVLREPALFDLLGSCCGMRLGSADQSTVTATQILFLPAMIMWR